MAFEWLIPLPVLALLAVAVLELLRGRRRQRQHTPLSATYVNEFTAIFYGSKRMELDHRDSQSILAEQDASGAPPFGVDLDAGTVTLPRPDHGPRP